MKKKLISFLTIISAFLFIGNVQAIEIDKDDISNGSYVIGTHLFERKVTEHYNGTLTVQHIMLAAKSIDSDNIEDMIIYLKNSRGKWVNGLTNESVNMPENIKIEYQNGEIKLEAPFIATGLGAHWDVNIVERGFYGYNENLALITGVEFYEKLDGQYTLIADATEEDSWGTVVEVNEGESKIIVAKVYHTDSKGNKVYSEYSNEFSIYSITYDLDGGEINEENPSSYIFDTENQLVPHIGSLNNPTREGYVFKGWTGSNGDTPQLEVTISDEITGNLHYVANWEKAALEAPFIATGLGAHWDVNIVERGFYGYNENLALITGVEFYEKLDGQYTLIADATEEDSWGTVVEVNEGESKIIVAKVYHTDSKGNKVYSEYSNEFSIYSITYDLDGGEISEENPTSYIFDTEYQIVPNFGHLNNPTKEGYTFLGWTGSNGNTPQIEVTITDGITGNLHYVANWKKDE